MSPGFQSRRWIRFRTGSRGRNVEGPAGPDRGVPRPGVARNGVGVELHHPPHKPGAVEAACDRRAERRLRVRRGSAPDVRHARVGKRARPRTLRLSGDQAGSWPRRRPPWPGLRRAPTATCASRGRPLRPGWRAAAGRPARAPRSPSRRGCWCGRQSRAPPARPRSRRRSFGAQPWAVRRWLSAFAACASPRIRTRPRSNSSCVIVPVGPAAFGNPAPRRPLGTNRSAPRGTPFSWNAMRARTSAGLHAARQCGAARTWWRCVGAIHALPVAHRICGFAQKPLGTSVNPPPKSAGRSKSTAALRRQPRRRWSDPSHVG